MALIRKDARSKVRGACILTEKAIKASMKLGGRTASGGRGAGEKLEKVGTYASAPGEPPRVQTGRLKASYTHEMHPALPIGRVGTNVHYGKTLEFGSRRVAARPHVRPVLHALRGAYRAIFGVKTKGM